MTTAIADPATATPKADEAGKVVPAGGVQDPGAPPAVAPKTEVTYDLKMPENTLLEPKAVERIVAEAKAQGLSNDQAKAVLDREHRALTSYATRQQADFDAQKAKWVEDVKADKELGGEGFAKSIESAKRVVDRFGSDKFRAVLNSTGLGNEPEVVRFLKKIGDSMADDKFVHPGSQTGGKKSMEDIFYGDKTKE